MAHRGGLCVDYWERGSDEKPYFLPAPGTAGPGRGGGRGRVLAGQLPGRSHPDQSACAARGAVPLHIAQGGDVHHKPVPRALIDDSGGDYALALDDLSGQISTGMLVAGLPVPQDLAVPPAQFRLADPALEVASIPISPVNGVGGQVQVGERINVYRLKRELETVESRLETIANETVLKETTQEKGEALLVATVPVVAVLSDQGLPASTDPDQVMPMRILVVAAPPEVIDAILEAVAMSELGNELLWVTLATP